MKEQQDYIMIFEAPKIVPPEFRLYYDDKGKVITYTCEKIEGNYIVIDALMFAQARPDVRVVDGKLSTVSSSMVISRLVQDTNEGVRCAKEDMSILVDDDYEGDVVNWKLKVYEL